jgi:hypothetical protein
MDLTDCRLGGVTKLSRCSHSGAISNPSKAPPQSHPNSCWRYARYASPQSPNDCLSPIDVCWPWYLCWERPLPQLRQSPPHPSLHQQASAMMPSLFRSWREKRRSPADRSASLKTSPPIPLPATSGILATNTVMIQPSEGLPVIHPIPDEPALAEAWNAVKDKAKFASTRGADIVGVSSALRILFCCS